MRVLRWSSVFPGRRRAWVSYKTPSPLSAWGASPSVPPYSPQKSLACAEPSYLQSHHDRRSCQQGRRGQGHRGHRERQGVQRGRSHHGHPGRQGQGMWVSPSGRGQAGAGAKLQGWGAVLLPWGQESHLVQGSLQHQGSPAEGRGYISREGDSGLALLALPWGQAHGPGFWGPLTSRPDSPGGPARPGGPTGPGGPRSPLAPEGPCLPGSP